MMIFPFQGTTSKPSWTTTNPGSWKYTHASTLKLQISHPIKEVIFLKSQEQYQSNIENSEKAFQVPGGNRHKLEVWLIARGTVPVIRLRTREGWGGVGHRELCGWGSVKYICTTTGNIFTLSPTAGCMQYISIIMANFRILTLDIP